ncbi:MAG: helix-turn-helix transcriptional regulator [Sedimentisphaerales bacterium]|nr:helix-turn-helix transcriptional regulator [Sedimentisphaerales bacterium]
MKSKIFGHVFSKTPDVTPRVLSTIDSVSPPSENVHKSLYPNWVLDYNFTRSDVCRIKDQAAPWRLRKQNIAHLYSPGTPYWEKASDKKIPVHCVWIIFDGGEKIGFDDITGQNGFARFIDNDNILGNLLLECASLGQEKGESGFWSVQSIFYRIIELLKNAQYQSDQASYIISETDNETDFVLQVQNYLKSNLSLKVTISEIATHFQMSDSSFAHTYKKLTGKTPIASLIDARINLAKNLLLRGYRMKAIAAQAGFNDEYHLSKAFKKHTGMSPRLYLRTQFGD